MVLIFIKMLVCFSLVVVYVKIAEPATNHFVLPFFTIYIIFTVFEVAVLDRQARIKPPPPDSK